MGQYTDRLAMYGQTDIKFEIVMQIVELKSLIFSSGDVISTTLININDIFGGFGGFGGSKGNNFYQIKEKHVRQFFQFSKFDKSQICSLLSYDNE